MDTTRRDLRVALRYLARRPGFTTVAVLTIALGVGASTAMFSVLHGVVLKPLPYHQPDRILQLHTVAPDGRRPPWSGGNFVDLAARATSYSAIAGHRILDYTADEGGFPTRISGASVTPGFFQVMGTAPILGRVFSPSADPPGGERTLVVGHGFWRSRLAADPSIVGRPLELNGESYTVVGVMPAGFSYPGSCQLWTASRFRAPEGVRAPGLDPGEDRDNMYFHVVARLRDGVSPAQARHEGQALAARLAADHPEQNRDLGFDLVTLHEATVGSVRPMLVVLFAAVALVLLIACANVASLLLAGASSRAHEVAVRTALGAGRWSIARQLLTESVALALIGGAAGVLLAAAGTRGVVSLAASDLPRASEVTMSLPVLLFALGAALLSGVVFGLAPALWLTRVEAAGALRDSGSWTVTGGAHGRARRLLVVAEIALSLMLLVGASLLVRTLARLAAVDPGFSERSAVTAQVWLPGSGDLEDEALRGFQDQVLERVRALPGVESAGAVLSLPVDWGVRAMASYSVEGRPTEPGAEPTAGLQAASPGYFETIGIPLLSGRTFTATDGPAGQPVAVVSEAFADRFLPGEDPIGRRIGSGSPNDEGFEWLTVVGVVGSTRYQGLDSEPREEVYVPLAQSPWPFMSLVLRTTRDPGTLAEPLRRAVMEIRTDQPVERIVTLEQVLHEAVARQRASMLLLGLFATLALVLATVGLYGVMSFAVTQRAREIGIRMAVGARPADIVRMVLGDGGRMVCLGLACGTVGALLLGGVMEGLLFRVEPTDPTAFAVAAATLTLGALLAAWIPARRAVRTDPVDALRSER